MSRFQYFLFLIVVIISLTSAGCLQERSIPDINEQIPTIQQERMLQQLNWVTDDTQSSLDGLDYSVDEFATLVGMTGISGLETDAALTDLATYHPAIINVIIYDPNGTILSAAPDHAKGLIGHTLNKNESVNTTLVTKKPSMSNLIPLAEGGEGAVLDYPIFSTDGDFIGVVSMAFSPHSLISPITEVAMEWAPYTYMVAQTNGRILYHTNPDLVGKETFNEATFADFPDILELAKQYSTNRSGYDTFTFYSIGSDKIVQKETYWSTTSLHGTEWRVLIFRGDIRGISAHLPMWYKGDHIGARLFQR
ncbi:MAG: hypothetical protein A4E36_01809 [Methanoregulaceae archaeon PtaB.Bin009]|nr:MAG: hypothetical protein A4E36_01809 [Methanoregulaceae archaeon PtaB.Bin009]